MEEKIKSVCDRIHFRVLFDSHAETLRNFVYYRCKDMQQAEDLTQEAFLKLWKNCKKVLYEKARGFLFTVARNAFYNQVAHRKVVLEYSKLPHSGKDGETPHFKLEEKEFMERLLLAINELPEGQREVFLLNRIDKVTYVEIAGILGISETAVEKRMQKALIKMRRIVKNI